MTDVALTHGADVQAALASADMVLSLDGDGLEFGAGRHRSP